MSTTPFVADVVVFFGKYFAAAVLLANIALMVLWGLIGRDARRAAAKAAEAESWRAGR